MCAMTTARTLQSNRGSVVAYESLRRGGPEGSRKCCMPSRSERRSIFAYYAGRSRNE